MIRITLLLLSLSQVTVADQVTLGDKTFTIPAGFKLERVADQAITKRPIVADFDEVGALYVAESSGSNDKVEVQLEQKPHSILRLTDTDGDGRFEQRTVFADRMMFPEGAMWHAGSMYVAAPPSIWKLTDTDDDGVADQREEWFDGKTLTGCANDLHGPYHGPDGWIYWCKGAFAEQSYDRPNADPLLTRAAHIFRRRPAGGAIEAVMTGGMDNPVEVAFTPSGERIFTTTFFQHPANGQRDGLVHAIYGGVYGKPHGVIDGHVRTGELMPVMTHLGAAAPSGIVRLQSNALGFENQLLTACFNLHKVTRHELVPSGATFKTIDTDLVASDDLDFHPTDVLEDADGSILIVDTGGWYKLCCPTSQLPKPDVLGAIYRLSRINQPPTNDARGNELDWRTATVEQEQIEEVTSRLADSRPLVQQRAVEWLAGQGTRAVTPLSLLLKNESSPSARTLAVWALCRIDAPQARAAVRSVLADTDTTVRQAAAHASSVWRDTDAVDALADLLRSSDLADRRVAAEALGRIGSPHVVAQLFTALQQAGDRVLEHSLTYAIIETGAVAQTRLGLNSNHANIQRAAIVALHAMPGGNLTAADVCAFFNHPDARLRSAAVEIAKQHPEWGPTVAQSLSDRLSNSFPSSATDTVATARLLANFAASEPVQPLIQTQIQDPKQTDFALTLLGQLEATDVQTKAWSPVLCRLLSSENGALVEATVQLLSPRTKSQRKDAVITESLLKVASAPSLTPAVRLMAMQDLPSVDQVAFEFLVQHVDSEQPLRLRGLAASGIAQMSLTSSQLGQLADAVPQIGPLELGRVLTAFQHSQEPENGRALFQSLLKSSAATSLTPDQLSQLAKQFGPGVEAAAKELQARKNVDPELQNRHLAELLAELPLGDVRRGQKVFHDQKTACFACHAIGYRGGTVGPDLSRIARIRSRRDLLEAIVYPSSSYVRSYEPVTAITQDGQSFNGIIKDQGRSELVLQINATEQRSIQVRELEEVLPGQVSLMPAGMEQQLSRQALADLLAYLESRR